MKNLAMVLLFAAFVGCKNTSNQEVKEKITDTVKTQTDGVTVVKQDSISAKKTVAKDTIRNYKDTQMNEEFFQKAIIDLNDSSFTVYQNIRADYRIFGYQKPDTSAKKMILFSVFTSDVEDNPYKCPLGSYYYSGALQDTKIKYIKNNGKFVETHLIKETNILPTPIFFLRNWVEFEKRN
jgi:ribosomal protein S24E